jgi:hypothetical protein
LTGLNGCVEISIGWLDGCKVPDAVIPIELREGEFVPKDEALGASGDDLFVLYARDPAEGESIECSKN